MWMSNVDYKCSQLNTLILLDNCLGQAYMYHNALHSIFCLLTLHPGAVEKDGWLLHLLHLFQNKLNTIT